MIKTIGTIIQNDGQHQLVCWVGQVCKKRKTTHCAIQPSIAAEYQESNHKTLLLRIYLLSVMIVCRRFKEIELASGH